MLTLPVEDGDARGFGHQPLQIECIGRSAKYGFSTVTGTVSSCTDDPEMLAVTTTASSASA